MVRRLGLHPLCMTLARPDSGEVVAMSLKLFRSLVIGSLSVLLGSSGCAGPTSFRSENTALPAVDLGTPVSIKTASFALG